MSKKEDLRIVKTRARLYRSFIKLLKTKSFESIKISDICKEASINRSTFYDHFDDKDKLLQGFISDMQNELERSLVTNFEYDNFIDYYMEIIKILLDYIEGKLKVYSSIINIKCSSYAKDMFTQALFNVTTLEVNKNFTNKTDISTDEILLFYASGISSIIILEINSSEGFDKNRIYNIIHKLIKVNEFKKIKKL